MAQCSVWKMRPTTLLFCVAAVALSQPLSVASSDATAAVAVDDATADAATVRPRYFDAVVVEAEGRAEGGGGGGAAGGGGGPLDAATCSLRPEQGPCRGYFSFFHYDAAAKRCRRFTYSGCGGNANKFRTQKACEEACGHLGLPDDKDKQQAAAAAAAAAAEAEAEAESAEAAREDDGDDCSWGRTPTCPRGCFPVNDARTDCPRCECSEESRRRLCAQPAARGHCRALLTRWRYDPASGDCAQFRFGGCDGNGNNFATRSQCLDACASPSPRTRD